MSNLIVSDDWRCSSNLILTESYVILTDIDEMKCILSDLDNATLNNQEFVDKANEYLGKFEIEVKHFRDDFIFVQISSHYGNNSENTLKDKYPVMNPTRYTKTYISKSPFSR